MVSEIGYTQERIHLDCPRDEWKKHRTTGKNVRIGRKRSLYMERNGSFKSVAKLCVDCNQVWLGDRLMENVSTTSKKDGSFGDKFRDTISSVWKRIRA